MRMIRIQNANDVIAILKRRFWLITISFATLSTLSGVVAYKLPNIYLSEALILVEPRKIPSDVVRDFVGMDTRERLYNLQKAILSRTNLSRIISEFKLYSDSKSGLNEEEKIILMRKNINVLVDSGRATGASFFKVSFEHKDPYLAQKVTSRLASLFIEYDNRTREQRVMGTAEFLEGELKRVESKLSEYAAQIADYKSRYRSELPEQLNLNLTTLTRLQEQLKANAEALDRSSARLVFLETQLAETPRVIEKVIAAQETLQPAKSPSSPVDYQDKMKKYQELLAQYTENHPDVIRLKKELEELGRTLPSEPAEPTAVTVSGGSRVISDNPIYKTLSEQLAEVKLEIQSRKAEREELLRQISLYSARIENTPKREQEIAIVQKEYNALNQQYDRLKSQLEAARLSESLENKQKGEQFRIEDPASLPLTPHRPNRKAIIMIGTLLSLALGLGLALAFESLDERIRSGSEVEEYLKLPVLVEIPEILTPGEARMRGALRTVGFSFCTAAASAVAYVFVYYFFSRGYYQALSDYLSRLLLYL